MRDFGAMRGAPWTVGDILRRMLLSWLTAVLVQYLSLRAELRGLEGLEGLAAQSVLLLLGMAAFLFVLLSLLARRFETLRLERWAIFVVFGILMITSLRASFAPRYLLACLMVLGVLGVYAWRGWCGTEKAVRRAGDRGRGGRIWTAVFATAFFIFVSFWTVYRVLTYRAPTFDFGIFSQMFHQMRTTGLPVTTVERDGPLSHFAVHVSPIYYLLLPFYCIYQARDAAGAAGGGFGVCSDSFVETLPPAWIFCWRQRRGLPAAPPLPGVFRRHQLRHP